MNPGDLIRHTGSKELFVVAQNQTPIESHVHLPAEEIVYAWDCTGQRIPLSRSTVKLEEAA